jgi:AAA domain
MRALTRAWTEDGGQVIGLAASAAAAVLREQTGIRTDTLAKLTWSLRNGGLPDWAVGVGPATLIIIDEAGMADTLSLHTAVRFAVDCGANVRLIGDDQQLAAIGAGGVLRDIKNSHGALQLTGLHRFTDPAEAQASVGLRDGYPSALSFYLNHGRVHVGDLAKITDDTFAAWIADRDAGSTRSCSLPPASSSPSSTAEPAIIIVTVPRPGKKASRVRKPGQCRRCDHHPRERSTPPPLGHRLGQERRPLDDHPHRPVGSPSGAAAARPRRLRRHHAWPSHRAGIPAATLAAIELELTVTTGLRPTHAERLGRRAR